MSVHYKVSGAEIFSGVGDLAIRHARIWVVAVGFLAVLSTGLDILLAGETEVMATFISSIVNFFVSYRVAEAILRRESLLATDYRYYGSWFVASILTTLGIGLGFLLLIVPGIYCMARWSMVTPLIVAEGKGASEALAESWARTKDCAWTLTGVHLVYTLGFGVVIGLIAMAGMADAVEAETTVVRATGTIFPFVVNLAFNALGMMGTLIGIAIYRALMGSAASYNDVFS